MTSRCIVHPAGLIFALGTGLPAAQAADTDPPGKAAVFYRTSIVAFTAGHTLDAASSWKRVYEANPLLRSANGQFAGKGLAIKSGLGAGALAGQWLIRRSLHGKARERFDRVMGSFNFGVGAAAGAVAVHNWRLGPPGPPR